MSTFIHVHIDIHSCPHSFMFTFIHIQIHFCPHWFTYPQSELKKISSTYYWIGGYRTNARGWIWSASERPIRWFKWHPSNSARINEYAIAWHPANQGWTDQPKHNDYFFVCEAMEKINPETWWYTFMYVVHVAFLTSPALGPLASPLLPSISCLKHESTTHSLPPPLLLSLLKRTHPLLRRSIPLSHC